MANTKNKRKQLGFFVNLDVWKFDVYVSLGQTHEEVIKHIPEMVDAKFKEDVIEILKGENPNADAYISKFENGAIFLRMYKFPEDADQYGTLSHEIFHAIDEALRHKGFKHTASSREAYAYAIGYLTTQILNKIW